MHRATLLGQRLMARDFDGHVVEFQVRIEVQNGFTTHGTHLENPFGNWGRPEPNRFMQQNRPAATRFRGRFALPNRETGICKVFCNRRRAPATLHATSGCKNGARSDEAIIKRDGQWEKDYSRNR